MTSDQTRPRRRAMRLRRRTWTSNVGEPTSLHESPQATVDLSDLVSTPDQSAELREQIVRTRADMENLRKRLQREKEEIRSFAAESLLRELTTPLDHFSLALSSFQSASDVTSLRQGVVMIHRELMSVLAANGLEEMQPDGQPFDPKLHEAGATDSDPTRNDGVVLQTLRPGWVLKGRVLRPALVKVNAVAAESVQHPSDDE